MFLLMKNCKNKEYSKGNCHLAWEYLVEKSAQLLLTLKKQFENSCLNHATDNVKAWIMELDDIYNQMNKIGFRQEMTNDNFMLYVMAICQKSTK